ncbi:MAG: hypothetical protein HC897_19715 [Thermoanaerobaculia bacterium]|nr:hypothetical protein [Thermoanaerobaculia bacterium]
MIELWADRGELQIVIDGFDELPTVDRKPWIEWLHRLRRTYPGLRTLLVSRPGVLVSEGWQRAVVQPWDRDRIEAFFLKSLDLDRDSFEQIFQQEQIREMASSPIVLAILVDTYRRRGTLPADRTALLRAYVDALLGRWDAARNLSGLRSTTSPQTLCRQLEQLAIELLRRGTAVFGLEDLEHWEEPKEEVRYLVERAGLLREVAGGRWAFSHRSLFEHFAAEGLADFGPRQALTVMHDHLDDPLWKDVLRLAATRLLTLVDEPGFALRQQLADVLVRLGESP